MLDLPFNISCNKYTKIYTLVIALTLIGGSGTLLFDKYKDTIIDKISIIRCLINETLFDDY